MKGGVQVVLRYSIVTWVCRRKGLERKFFYLLQRMKGRIDQKGKEGVFRKTSLKSSKSNRELKKLEWTVSYKKTKIGFSGGIFEGASKSGCK